MVICCSILLDAALLRPGRIDRMIYVGLPDQESRRRILELGMKGKACCEDLDVSMDLQESIWLRRPNDCWHDFHASITKIQTLAEDKISGGLSGAELVSACRDAALAALEEDEAMEDTNKRKPAIAMRHLQSALQESDRQITPEMLDFYNAFRGD